MRLDVRVLMAVILPLAACTGGSKPATAPTTTEPPTTTAPPAITVQVEGPTIIARPGYGKPLVELSARDGRRIRDLPASTGELSGFEITPDGTHALLYDGEWQCEYKPSVELDLDSGAIAPAPNEHAISISPDGTQFAFVELEPRYLSPRTCGHVALVIEDFATGRQRRWPIHATVEVAEWVHLRVVGWTSDAVIVAEGYWEGLAERFRRLDRRRTGIVDNAPLLVADAYSFPDEADVLQVRALVPDGYLAIRSCWSSSPDPPAGTCAGRDARLVLLDAAGGLQDLGPARGALADVDDAGQQILWTNYSRGAEPAYTLIRSNRDGNGIVVLGASYFDARWR